MRVRAVSQWMSVLQCVHNHAGDVPVTAAGCPGEEVKPGLTFDIGRYFCLGGAAPISAHLTPPLFEPYVPGRVTSIAFVCTRGIRNNIIYRGAYCAPARHLPTRLSRRLAAQLSSRAIFALAHYGSHQIPSRQKRLQTTISGQAHDSCVQDEDHAWQAIYGSPRRRLEKASRLRRNPSLSSTSPGFRCKPDVHHAPSSAGVTGPLSCKQPLWARQLPKDRDLRMNSHSGWLRETDCVVGEMPLTATAGIAVGGEVYLSSSTPSRLLLFLTTLHHQHLDALSFLLAACCCFTVL